MNGDANAADVNPAAVLTKGQRAFFRLPNEVARDKRVPPALLVLIAYRGTFVDEVRPYGLNEECLTKEGLVKPKSGLGRGAIRRAVARGVAIGYPKRDQPSHNGDGRWRYAVDRLTLPACGNSGFASRHVARAWFDGGLSLKGMAASRLSALRWH